MKGNTKSTTISVAELKKLLERGIAAAHDDRDPQSSRGKNRSKQRRDPASNSPDFNEPALNYCRETARAEFDSWCAMAREPGPFYALHSRIVVQMEERSAALFRNCDAFNPQLAERLVPFLCERWIYSESEAQEVFGEYLRPLLATEYLLSISVSRKVAKLFLKARGDIPENITMVYPSIGLIEFLSWYSSKLTFILGFVLASMQEWIDDGRARGEVRDYSPIWIAGNDMLLDSNSALHRALKAPIPPLDELELLAKHFGLKSKSYGAPAPILKWNQDSPTTIRRELKAILPESAKSGAVVVVNNHRQRTAQIMCAPKVLQGMIDSLSAHRTSEAPNDQVYAAREVVLALGDLDRQEFFASLYGAATRGDLNLTMDGRFTVACLNKISNAQWPGISSVVTRDIIERLIVNILSKYENMIGEFDSKACMPEDLFRKAPSVIRSLSSIRFIDLLVRACGAAPDMVWIPIERVPDLVNLANYSRHIAREIDSGNSGLLDDIFLHGWFCGFVDLAFVVDKKGLKSKIKGVRVNQTALRAALIPEVSTERHERTAKEREAPRLGHAQERVSQQYSSKADVLPNGEILCPPDLHPAIRFCLATLFRYTRSNIYAISVDRKAPYRALKVCNSDLLELLTLLSRTPVPKIISDQLPPEEESSPTSGVFVPTFVLTESSAERARLILKELDRDRFFAIEISPNVWGFFDRYAASSFSGLRYFDARVRTGNSTELRKIFKDDNALGFRLHTDLRPLTTIGTIPTERIHHSYQRGDNNSPSLEPVVALRDVFDLDPNDKAWQEGRIGVDIFSLVPTEIRAAKAFQIAMAPCLAITKTRMNAL